MRRYYKRYGHHGSFNRNFGHFKERLRHMTSENGLYRSRKGIFMGVCKGFAQYFNFSVFWTRIIALLLFLFTGFWPIGVFYIVAGLLMKVEPVSPIDTETDKEFYDSYTQSRSSAIQRIKRKFENIERRIQRMEHTVTSREFDWK